MPLLHTLDRVGDTAYIVVAGDIDVSSAAQLRRILLDVMTARPRRIAIDVRGLVFIDSTGIGEIVGAHHSARQQRIDLYLTNPRGQVQRALAVAGVLKSLTHANPDERPAPNPH